jgi:hypothetical protein
MSILSGIGQIPPIFGGGGNTNAVIYEIPADINALTGGGTTQFFVQNLPVPNGSYLVIYNIDLVAGDNTTVITGLRLASTSGVGFTQVTPIYNTTLISGQPFNMNATGLVDVANGLVNLAYEVDQTGNASTLTMPEYDPNTESGIIYLLPIVPPQ